MMEKIYHKTSNQKRVKEHKLVSDIIGFKPKIVTREKEYFIIKKVNKSGQHKKL